MESALNDGAKHVLVRPTIDRRARLQFWIDFSDMSENWCYLNENDVKSGQTGDRKSSSLGWHKSLPSFLLRRVHLKDSKLRFVAYGTEG